MSTRIFTAGGGYSWHTSKDDEYQYITLAGNSGRELGSILMGRAPAANIDIQDDLDFTLNKSFSGDMLVSTFGHKPVSIQITGFDLYKGNGCNDTTSTRIQDFWANHNVHKNNAARVLVSLNGVSSLQYICILVGMRSQAAGMENTPGIGGYAISLIGVPV